MTLRASIGTGEHARMLDGSGRWMFMVEVKRRTDSSWVNLSDVAGGDWVLSLEAEIDTPDVSVSQFTVRLLRTADGQSTAPGISGSALNISEASDFSPLVYPGRLIRVNAYCADVGETRDDADWHLWLDGHIKTASWDDDVVASCVNGDGEIQKRQIEAKERRGSPEPGVPVELEIQGLLDRWMGAGSVALVTDGDPEFNLGEYETDPGSLGDFLLSQARRIGWDLRHRWNDGENNFRYTLYLPPRDKMAPDLTLSPDHITQVPGLTVDEDPVRNAFSHTYRDATTRRITVNAAQNDASIGDYGRIWMGITEDEDSPVNTDAKSDALLAFAKNDLGQPPVEKKVRMPFLPFLALHHMVRVEADGIRFDYDQDYSVVGGNHVVSSDDLYTSPNLRGGSPIGMYYAWKRRSKGDTALHDWLIELVEPVGSLETPTSYTFRIVGGDDVYEIWWAYDIVSGEPTKEQWDDVASIAEAGQVLSTLPVATVTIPKPLATETGLLYLAPKILDAGVVVPPPVQDSARYVPIFGPQVLGPSLNVQAVGGETEYTITWAGDAVELSINGGDYAAPPASPFTVLRPAVGASPIVYTFAGHRDGIEATDNVLIQPLGVELVPVDLAVNPVSAGTDNAQATFNATALRLDTLDAIPVKVLLHGCEGTNNGASLPEGEEQTVAGLIVVFRPAFEEPAGLADFYAEILGYAFERIGRGIQPVQQDTVGPSLEVVPGVPTATTLPISWTSSAGSTISITWTTGLSVVFNTGTSTSASGSLTITRPDAGDPAGLVTFFGIRDGVYNTDTVSVPPVGADTVTPSLAVNSPVGYTDDNATVYFEASASNPRTGASVPVSVTLYLCTATVDGAPFVSGSVLATGDVLAVARPAFGEPGGTVTFSASVASAGEIYGGTATVQRSIAPSQQDTAWPAFEVDRAENDGTGTAWVKFTERGIGITSVESRTQVSNLVFGTFGTPTRSVGDASVVKGGTLGALEFETDVALVTNGFSLVDFRAALEGEPNPLSVPTFYFDRQQQPRIVKAQAQDQRVEVIANTDTYSLKAERTDVAGWSGWVDGPYATFEVPVPASDTWPIRVTAYGAAQVDVTGGTQTDERNLVVAGSSAPAEPAWSLATLDAPDIASDEVTLTLEATSAPAGYAMQVFIQVGGGAWADITADTGSVIPTSADTYTYATGFPRSAPPGLTLTVQTRADILDVSGAVVATTDTLPSRPACSYTL